MVDVDTSSDRDMLTPDTLDTGRGEYERAETPVRLTIHRVDP